MTEWRRLAFRRGLTDVDGPFEGVPAHLKAFVLDWIRLSLQADSYTGAEPLGTALALLLRIPTDSDSSKRGQILWACQHDDDLLLDVLDAILFFKKGERSQDLETSLKLGGSVWRVAEDERALVRRVSDTEQAAFDEVAGPQDEATTEIRTAWAKVYGRSPDPSDAWDHAIKAVEVCLWPIITPQNAKATLGTIIAELSRHPDEFSFRLNTSSNQATTVEAVTQLLRLMWPNPDRHATGTSRVPSAEEAQDIVHLAVLVLRWVRSGALAKS